MEPNRWPDSLQSPPPLTPRKTVQNLYAHLGSSFSFHSPVKHTHTHTHSAEVLYTHAHLAGEAMSETQRKLTQNPLEKTWVPWMKSRLSQRRGCEYTHTHTHTHAAWHTWILHYCVLCHLTSWSLCTKGGVREFWRCYETTVCVCVQRIFFCGDQRVCVQRPRGRSPRGSLWERVLILCAI